MMPVNVQVSPAWRIRLLSVQELIETLLPEMESKSLNREPEIAPGA